MALWLIILLIGPGKVKKWEENRMKAKEIIFTHTIHFHEKNQNFTMKTRKIRNEL